MKNGIAVIDNYDSFTYNLIHAVKHLIGADVPVFRNDDISIDDLNQYSTLILSPGPGVPSEAGMLKEIISHYAPLKKILGVCLGQQAIGEVFGGKLKNLDKVFHGVKTKIIRTDIKSPLYEDIPDEFEAGRYHSWVIDRNDFPGSLEITCLDEHSEIMGIKHRNWNVHGVQFHPESVLTPLGEKIIENFLFRC